MGLIPRFRRLCLDRQQGYEPLRLNLVRRHDMRVNVQAHRRPRMTGTVGQLASRDTRLMPDRDAAVTDQELTFGARPASSRKRQMTRSRHSMTSAAIRARLRSRAACEMNHRGGRWTRKTCPRIVKLSAGDSIARPHKVHGDRKALPYDVAALYDADAPFRAGEAVDFRDDEPRPTWGEATSTLGGRLRAHRSRRWSAAHRARFSLSQAPVSGTVLKASVHMGRCRTRQGE